MTTQQVDSTETLAKISHSAGAYLERLQERHERFAETVETVRARNARIGDKLVETIIAAQRDALELSKTVASQPTALAKNLEIFMHSLTAAQERALDFTKTVYREQTEAAADARAITVRVLESSKSLGKPFEKITALWIPAAK